MATKVQEPTPPEQRKQKDGLLETVVRDNVMSSLGRPAGLNRVQVNRVWGNHYRVNVFVGTDFTSSKVAHSYFLEADGDGKILSSCPAITKMY